MALKILITLTRPKKKFTGQFVVFTSRNYLSSSWTQELKRGIPVNKEIVKVFILPWLQIQAGKKDERRSFFNGILNIFLIITGFLYIFDQLSVIKLKLALHPIKRSLYNLNIRLC